jgi:hypothetical protein
MDIEASTIAMIKEGEIISLKGTLEHGAIAIQAIEEVELCKELQYGDLCTFLEAV